MSKSIAAVADDRGFGDHSEPYRKELLAHAYRMLGSFHEAEDAIQETYLRAWRSYPDLENKDLIRPWLYRIATNVCLTAIGQRQRRALPSGIGNASHDPATVGEIYPPDTWIQPIPDTAIELTDPARVVISRESMRLALIASLQHLPARQRAVLLLRDVLAFPASEVAAMLDISIIAVKSALQRARKHLHEADLRSENLLEPDDSRARELLDQYIEGFENANFFVLEKALRADARLETVPTSAWFAGKFVCMGVFHRAIGAAGNWKMIPTLANGQPAAVAYLKDNQGIYQAFGLGVLSVTVDGIKDVVSFADPALPKRFGFPDQLGQ